MNRLRNEKGIALAAVMVLAMVALALTASLAAFIYFASPEQITRGASLFPWAVGLLLALSVGYIVWEVDPAYAISGVVVLSALAGNWSGEGWGQIVLNQTTPGEYAGTYSDTVSKQPGKIELRWSRIERRFNGRWSEGEDRFAGRRRLADVGVEQSWVNFKPRVNVAFQYGWEKNNTLKLDGIRPWALSLSVRFPIFSSFGDFTNLEKARYELKRTEAQVESFRRALLMQAANARLSLRAARQRGVTICWLSTLRAGTTTEYSVTMPM